SKLRTMEHLGLNDEIEDILITLSSQYHLIRLLKGRGGNGLFLYLVLDSGRANLAMARHQLRRLEAALEVCAHRAPSCRPPPPAVRAGAGPIAWLRPPRGARGRARTPRSAPGGAAPRPSGPGRAPPA